MNWLTHLFLSTTDIDYQLGNLLADSMKRVTWDDPGESFSAGMRMHRAIDAFADGHPIVSASKARLRDKGYLKGVVIDILHDHFLSRHWDTYCGTPLPEYLETFHRRSTIATRDYPRDLRDFVDQLILHEGLAQYGTLDGFAATLHRLDRRLSPRIKRRERSADYLPDVLREYDQLEADFNAFFPELVKFFEQHSTAG